MGHFNVLSKRALSSSPDTLYHNICFQRKWKIINVVAYYMRCRLRLSVFSELLPNELGSICGVIIQKNSYSPKKYGICFWLLCLLSFNVLSFLSNIHINNHRTMHKKNIRPSHEINPNLSPCREKVRIIFFWCERGDSNPYAKDTGS